MHTRSACKTLRLAVEIDGSSHDFKGAADVERRKELEAAGVSVHRVPDAEVRRNMADVLVGLKACMQRRAREIGLAFPLLAPSRDGQPSAE